MTGEYERLREDVDRNDPDKRPGSDADLTIILDLVVQLRDALAAVEWGQEDSIGACPSCGRYSPQVHEADCILSAAIAATREAGSTGDRMDADCSDCGGIGWDYQRMGPDGEEGRVGCHRCHGTGKIALESGATE